MRILRWFGMLLLVAAGTATGWIVGRFDLAARPVPTAALDTRERAFADRLNRASLVGRFTVDGREDRPASEDRYDISSIEKVGEDRWRFNVRMRHGSVDVTVPVVMPVTWVGDVPAIAVSNYAIPGLGTFSTHIFFEGDRYGGTWANPKVGGHLFGRIERQQ
ncbi:MAG: hypothetical protein AB7P67_15045 [Vicinamibacterales bacterium]